MPKEIQRLPVINNRASNNDPTLTITEILNSMEHDVSLILEKISRLESINGESNELFSITQDVGGLGFGICHLQEMLNDG